MERHICIMNGTACAGFFVNDAVAAKMLEVYDKSKKFQPVKIDMSTIVSVCRVPSQEGYPVCVQICGRDSSYSLGESLAFAEALVNAVKHVKNFA